jgi:nucleotide-binding universal stress UspA family protein
VYRTILVHVDRDAGSEERTRLAVGLARQHDARLIGLVAGLPRLPVEFYAHGVGVVAAGPDLETLDRAQLDAEFDLAEAEFKKTTAGSGLKTEWRAAMDLPSNAIVAAANTADILVTGPGDRSLLGDYRLASAGDVLMRCGRPVLVVPEGLDSLDVRTVVVAWKDRREARRAVLDALPMMKGARSTLLFHIDEGPDGARAASDVQSALAGHGVAATLHVEPPEEGTIADQVIRFARRSHADLLVAGAYGHTRFREWAFGGMTRGLLAGCPIPCLMSH